MQSLMLNISWSGTSCHEPHLALPFPSCGVQAASTQIEDAPQDLNTQVCMCSHSCHHLKVKPAAWWPTVPHKTQESIVTKTANSKCQAEEESSNYAHVVQRENKHILSSASNGKPQFFSVLLPLMTQPSNHLCQSHKLIQHLHWK